MLADSVAGWLTACYVSCRDVVEQALPVLVGQQWSRLQHHSLADKLQVSMPVAMPGRDAMLVKMCSRVVTSMLVGMSMLVGALVGKMMLAGMVDGVSMPVGVPFWDVGTRQDVQA